MKMSKNGSPYSKMYLIPPNMYEKLLDCLNQKEIRQAEDINIETGEEIKPGEKEVEMLSKEALEQQTPEGEITEQPSGAETEIKPFQEEIVETQMDPEDVPLKRTMKGSISFKKPDLTCKVCLKTFKNAYGLSRHTRTVHKNLLEQGLISEVPSMLKIRSGEEQQTPPEFITEDIYIEDEPEMIGGPSITPRQTVTPRFVGEEDVEMMQDIKPHPLKQKCKVSSDGTTRCIPELYFKPPRSGEMMVPQISKRMMLVPKFGKTTTPKLSKRTLLVPTISKRIHKVPELKSKDLRRVRFNKPPIKKRSEQEDLMSFEDWEPTKKKGSRTASEASLKGKPRKYIPPEEFEEWTKDN